MILKHGIRRFFRLFFALVSGAFGRNSDRCHLGNAMICPVVSFALTKWNLMASSSPRKIVKTNYSGTTKYTKMNPPLRIIARQRFPDRRSAAQAEYAMKRLTPLEKRQWAYALDGIWSTALRERLGCLWLAGWWLCLSIVNWLVASFLPKESHNRASQGGAGYSYC